MPLPRNVLPTHMTPLSLPPPDISGRRSGKLQARAGLSAGWMWTETWEAMARIPQNAMDATPDLPAVIALVASIAVARPTVEGLDVQHLQWPGSGAPKNGQETQSIRVRGAGQIGSALAVNGLTPNLSRAVAHGDILNVAGLPGRYMATADVNADATGAATIPVHPAMTVAPQNGGIIETEGVAFRVLITDWTKPQIDGAGIFRRMSVTFREAL